MLLELSETMIPALPALAESVIVSVDDEPPTTDGGKTLALVRL